MKDYTIQSKGSASVPTGLFTFKEQTDTFAIKTAQIISERICNENYWSFALFDPSTKKMLAVWQCDRKAVVSKEEIFSA